METENDLTNIGARIDALSAAVREQAGHLAELHRCIARLQAQIAALERGGQRGDAIAELEQAVLQELSRRAATEEV